MSGPTRRRDWFQIIRCDLVHAGISVAKIASACKRDPKTVDNWIGGGEPKDSDAQIVLALYRKFCPEKFVEHMKKFDPNYTPVELPESPRKKHQPRSTPADRQVDLFEGSLP